MGPKSRNTDKEEGPDRGAAAGQVETAGSVFAELLMAAPPVDSPSEKKEL